MKAVHDGLISTAGIVTSNLVFLLDAGETASYSGSGTTWSSIIGSTNNLTLTGSPTFTSAGSSSYFTFNGSSQYARTATIPSSLTNNFSMCGWIYPANINQIGVAVQNGRDDGANPAYNGYGFGVGNGAGSAGAKLQAAAWGVAWIDPGYTFPSANAWYYIVMLRDAGTFKFYVNGTQTASTSATVPNTPTENFSIGAGFGVVGARYFNGRISVVQFYSKVLSQSEITQNYNAQKGRYGL
jgi:hypothetical protein